MAVILKFLSCLGGPSIVFLDEPSTGMDPMSRRFMWKVIAKMSTQDARCSVILTTHSKCIHHFHLP